MLSAHSCVFCKMLSDRAFTQSDVVAVDVDFEASKYGVGVASLHRRYRDGPVLSTKDGILVNVGIDRPGA
jgi:hypothetical protein